MLEPQNQNNNKISSKSAKTKEYRRKIRILKQTVKELENSLIESQHCDRKILMAVHMDSLENKNLHHQLEEALKENDQFINILQLRNETNELARAPSKVDIGSSCSTMSLVNLQYKYEELLNRHNGLLKILELRNSELKKYTEENAKLQKQIEEAKANLDNKNQQFSRLHNKFTEMKRKKDEKIFRLKHERQTLGVVHNRLVALLHRQCMEKSEILNFQLRNTPECDRALLLQETHRNNLLAYENFQLQQELEYLRSILSLKSNKSSENVRSEGFSSQ